MKQIYLLFLASFFIFLTGCRAVMSDRALIVNRTQDMSLYKTIPALIPVVDKKLYDEVYSVTLRRFQQYYPEYRTNFFYEDASKLFQRNLYTNVCMTDRGEYFGYIKCDLLDAKLSDKAVAAYVIPAVLTGCTIYLFGWPLSAGKVDQEMKFEIFNCKDEVVKTYRIKAHASKPVGFYYGYTRDHYRNCAVYAYKNALKEFNRQISKDAYEIKNNLLKAGSELKDEQKQALDAVAKNNKLYVAGCKEIQQEKWNDALSSFDEVIHFSPYHAYAYLNRGLAYLNTKQYTKALQDISRSVQLMPDMGDVWFYKSLVLSQLRRGAEALVSIERAINLQPENENFRVLYGSMLEESGYWEEAKRQYTKVLAMNPDRVEINDWLAAINEKITSQKIMESEAEVQRALQQAQALQAVGQALNNTAAVLNQQYQQVNTVTPANTVSNKKTNTAASRKKKECSLCHGTGKNPAKERPGMYDSTTEDYSRQPCSVCGSRTNHWHKDCPSCRGKGYN